MPTIKVECPKCEGTGRFAYERPDGYAGYDECKRCKGTGEIEVEAESNA